MTTNVLIPQTENRKKILAFKVSGSEKDMIDKFCKDNSIRKSDLLRFALKKLIPTF